MRQEHLDDLIEQSSEFGVELEIEDHVDHLWLGFIRRTCARRGAGVLVMQDLIEISEEWGIPIRCAVATDAEALIDWYLAMGFGIETMADVEGGRPLHAILFRSPECAPMRAGSFQLQEA